MSAFIRQYNPETDLEAVITIFKETAHEALKVEPLWTIGSYIWCRPYLVLHPSTCFVVDDGTGHAVGYILGTPDTVKFCERWREEYAPKVVPELERLAKESTDTTPGEDVISQCMDLMDQIVDDPERLVMGDLDDMIKPYPGHLHIDILPSHQGMGLGKKLIEQLRSVLKAEGCPGGYLGMVAANSRAAKFYETCGFKRLPHVLDDGQSGEQGRTTPSGDGPGTIYYVYEC
jgi:GNAT superfamily N-acetyltransferase